MQKNTRLIFGLHAVKQVFDNDISRVLELWVQQDRHDQKMQTLLEQITSHHIAPQTVPRKTLDKLTDNAQHQGIVIRCYMPDLPKSVPALLETLPTPPLLLVLDEVQDPHNVGACLRTADAAGVQGVIVPKNRACSLSSTVYKVASGAADHVPLIEVTNLARTLRELQEHAITVVGTADDATTSLYAAQLTGAMALVLGAEGHGLRRLTRETCDVLVNIPMFGKVESLNVSVATGICLYEAVRQRLVQAN